MSELAFLSPDRAVAHDGFEPRLTSPLARALRGDKRVRDLSGLGKIEFRGTLGDLEVEAEVVPITPHRTLVLCDYERCAEVRAALPGLAIDVTGALAGLELEGERVLRRLTDVDLDTLPAVAKLVDVPALILRDGDRFRIFVPQELGHYVAEVVLDTLDGFA